MTEINREKEVNKPNVDQLIALNEFAYSYGLLKGKEPNVKKVSFSLNPKLFTSDQLEKLKQGCFDFNHVIVRFLNEFPKMFKFYKDYSNGDELLECLIDLYEKIEKRRKIPAKPVILINRNDFMYDTELCNFLQIEYNLAASSLGFFSYGVNKLIKHYYHTHTDKKIDLIANNYPKFQRESFKDFLEIYGNPDAYVVTLCDEEGFGYFEWNEHEKTLIEGGINCFRVKSNGFNNSMYKIDDKNNLIMNGKEIGVLYQRCLYDYSHFTEELKEFIIAVECSNCLCLPSVEANMIGIKLNQNFLNNKKLQKQYGVTDIDMKDFGKNLCSTYLLKDHFDNDKEKMVEFIKKDLTGYLMKTFKEGGFGDILVGETMLNFINENDENTLNRFLLVRKIKSPILPSQAMIEGEFKQIDNSISEIGHYSTIVIEHKDGKYVLKKQYGDDFLLRTKDSKTVKGGVAVNAAFVDSIRIK